MKGIQLQGIQMQCISIS